MLNSKEKYKLEVVKSAICGNITNCEASKLLSVSERQIKRLKRDVRKLGAGRIRIHIDDFILICFVCQSQCKLS
jgi:hypothetical protein